MTLSLYAISAEYRSAIEHIDPETGEVDDDLEHRLEAIGGTLVAKTEAVVQYRANVIAEAAAYKAEAERLTERRRALDAKAARLREYLGVCLRVAGETKVTTACHVVSLKTNPPKVILDVDAGKLGERWLKAQDPKPDMVAIKAALKAGDDDAGRVAHLEAGESVQIK